MSLVLHGDVAAKVEGGEIKVDPRNDTKRARAMWGTYRSLLANVMTGVTKGFERRLEITGVGYRATVQGKNLQIQLGYSHDIVYPIPDGITIAVPKADRDRRDRHRRAEGRPRRRGNPRLPQARALQGQGHQIRGRVHLPQGRQEEVMGAHDGDSYDRTMRRTAKVRRNVRRAAGDRARLSVFRSSKHIYAQVIDDAKGRDRRVRLVAGEGDARQPQDRRQYRGRQGGRKTGRRARAAKGIKDVVFDRGGYLYHGRVKALADAAREGGLNF